MSVRNKFLIILGVIFAISLTYYLVSTPSNKDLILDRHSGFEPSNCQPANRRATRETTCR